jgi:hypothetical protein
VLLRIFGLDAARPDGRWGGPARDVHFRDVEESVEIVLRDVVVVERAIVRRMRVLATCVKTFVF